MVVMEWSCLLAMTGQCRRVAQRRISRRVHLLCGMVGTQPARAFARSGRFATLRKRTLSFSPRIAPESCRKSLALAKQRARGMPGAQCTRSLVCAVVAEYAHQYS